MNINRMGYHNEHPTDFTIHREQGSGDYLLLLITTPAFITLDGEAKNYPGNTFILYKKGTPQHYGATGVPYINDWIHLELHKKEESIFEELSIPLDTPIYIDDISRLSLVIQELTSEFYSEHLFHSENMQLLIKFLLNKISEILNAQKSFGHTPHYQVLQNLRNEIFNFPAKDWTVDLMCKEVGLSRSTLSHLYKDIFQETMMNDVIKSRINYGKYLLSSTTLSVYRIADLCGYHNEIHFMRQFKALEQMTPSQYRNTLRP